MQPMLCKINNSHQTIIQIERKAINLNLNANQKSVTNISRAERNVA